MAKPDNLQGALELLILTAARTSEVLGALWPEVDAERKLWYRLRSRSILGFKFVRQEPIGPYVVDSFAANGD